MTRFSKTAIVCCTSHMDRIPSLKAELRRVGMADAEMFIDSPCLFNDLLKGLCPMHRFVQKSRNVLNITMNHYRAVRQSFLKGCGSLLMMEDDIRFLKDTRAIGEVLDDLPEDYDIAMLNYNKRGRATDEELMQNTGNKVSRYWSRFFNLRSAATYALSRRGMERLVETIEDGMRGKDGIPLHHIDWYFQSEVMKGLNLYCSIPKLSIQVPVGTSGSHSGKNAIEFWWNELELFGNKRGDYAD